MEEFLSLLASEMAPIVNTIIIALVGTISTAVGIQIRKLVKRMERHEIVSEIADSLKNNKEIVKASVEYVEIVGKHLANEKKFELAKVKALDFANKYGISISNEELDILIEQAVYNLKEGYKKEKEEDISIVIDDESEVKFINGEQVDGYHSDQYGTENL